ncbi:MAG: hypothetical protein JWO53_402 [Chlamydiia bacterium]|nr:hypothetical protein [Chlamydiia bacterium]
MEQGLKERLYRYQELIALSKQYIQELPPSRKSIPCSEESLTYFSQYSQKAFLKPAQKPLATPTPKPLQVQPSAPQPQAKIMPQPPENKPAAPQAPTPKTGAPTPKATPQAQSTTFPFLPRKFPEASSHSFGDIEQKLKTLAPQLALHQEPLTDTVAGQKSSEWKAKYPRMVIISFLTSDSQEKIFITTVTEAVNTRLAPCALYHLPEKRFAAELATLAQCDHIHTILFVHDHKTASQANEFSLFLSLTAQESKETPCTQRGTLYGAAVYDLAVTDTLQKDPTEKAALWKQMRLFTQKSTL